MEIVNGVDDEDLPVGDVGPVPGRFVLAYVGTLYGIRDPGPVLAALAALADRGAIDRERVALRLVGSMWLEGFQPPTGIEVEVTGYVDHVRAVAEMCRATALLLYVPGTSLAPSGKLFEYLASGRPLLCIANERNLASRLVREWGAGVVADPDDREAIEQAILELWRRWEADGLPRQDDVRERTLATYSRRATAAQLAEVLEQASEG